MVKSTSRYLQQLVMPVHVLQLVLNSLFYYLTYVIYWISKLSDSAFMAYSFVWRCLQLLFSASQHLLHWRRSSTRDVDPEAQGPDQNLDIVTTNQDPLKLKLPDTPTSDLEAPSIMWLIETSTDPEVFYAAASLVPDVDWPLDLDVSDTLHQLYDVYTTCLDIQKQIIPSLEEKASACTKALCHLYCHRIFQGRPAYRLSDKGSIDYYVFKQMLGRTKVDDNVLVATTMLFVAKYKQPYWWLSSPKFGAHPDSVPLLKWLSRTLPFHYVTGKVNEDVQELAMTVISKLLCSSSSLSPQIIANCTLLACVMVGVQFDKKDIVRVDKSPALRQLIESLWTQLLKVCSLDGRDLDEDITGDVRRAWNLLDIFCHILALGLPYPVLPKPMWILGVCGKIYSRARSFQHTDQDSSAALRKARRFRLASDTNQSMFVDPADPAWLWEHQISWRCNSHSSEDFDWLVDYLGDVCSSDHKTAGDILVLLSSMRVGCSPAKQHLFIEALIACMSSSMPPRLRHAALRAAHSSQEVLASIDIVGHADMVLTNLSLAILTAVCPQPGATATDYGPDRSFYYERDLCYLELIFALARNSCWRPHLHCQTDRAIRILALRHGARSRHTFYLVSFFLRMSSEEASATSLSSITEQQWWDMMSQAWYFAEFVLNNTQCVEFLPVLVERTKKYMHVAPQDDLWQLIKDVDGLIERPELKQREGVTDAVKVLRSIANDMLAK
ncbi:hypothetical protein BDR07DRAFT_71445 [Suillus spraguei]|nr:hypothetical protein BDR07DRAFT_71445 [Suillus spraguei]